MFCPQCGAPVPDAARYCSSCGTRLPQAEPPSVGSPGEMPAHEQAAQPQAAAGALAQGAPGPAGRGRFARKGRAALVLSALLVLLVAGGAAASYLLLPRSPKQLFFEVQRSYVAGLAAEIRTAQKARLDLERLMAERPSRTHIVITGGTRGLDEADALFKDSALEMDVQLDPRSQATGITAGFRLRGEDLISAEFWQTPDYLALHVPELEREYIVLENRNLRQFFRDRGFYDYTGPDRIETENRLRAVLRENEDELARLAAGYARLVYDFIAEEEVTLEKGVQYSSPDGPVELDRLVLRLSEARLRELLTHLAASFRDDDEALGLLSEIAAAAAANGGPELADWQDPAHARSRLREGADKVAASLAGLNFPAGLTWTVYTDGKRLVDQKLEFTVENAQGRAFPVAVQAADWGSPDAKRTRSGKVSLRSVYSPSYEDELVVEWRSTTTAAGKDRAETEVALSFEVYEGGERAGGLHLSDTAVTDRNVQKGKDRTTHDFTLKLSDYGSEAEFSGTLSTLASNAVQNNRFEQDVTMTLAVEPMSPWDPAFDLELTISTATEVLEGQLDLPDLTGAKRLNDMSDQEIEELLMGMGRSLDRLMQRSVQLLLGF